MVKLVIVLIAAHIIADFFLQSDGLVNRKHKFRFLFLHATIPAAVSFLLLQAWTCWLIPVYICLVHALIDLAKQQFPKDSARAFLADQSAHIASLGFLAWLLIYLDMLSGFPGVGYASIVFIAGFTAAVWGAGHLVAKVMGSLNPENVLGLEGLPEGGKLIGELERALIFFFICTGHPMGIGFLLAGKSILRFHEATKQTFAEYVLIGTLLSFTLAIAIAAVTNWAVAL